MPARYGGLLCCAVCVLLGAPLLGTAVLKPARTSHLGAELEDPRTESAQSQPAPSPPLQRIADVPPELRAFVDQWQEFIQHDYPLVQLTPWRGQDKWYVAMVGAVLCTSEASRCGSVVTLTAILPAMDPPVDIITDIEYRIVDSNGERDAIQVAQMIVRDGERWRVVAEERYRCSTQEPLSKTWPIEFRDLEAEPGGNISNRMNRMHRMP